MTAAQRTPRLGFLGVGWIGRNRLEAIAESGLAEIVGVSDPHSENASAASELAGCSTCSSLEELLEADLDGIVIATPSALHAEQSIAAFERGVAVFCQKPLGRTEHETRRVVAAARRANKLLGVDFSYRFVSGVGQMRDIVGSGELGTIYAADLVFHNAYGPDKPWFYDPALSGGGCVIDLGSHLVDLALWVLEGQEVVGVSSRLFARGERLNLPTNMVEDYATAQLDFSRGASVRLACSWNLSAGCDAVIEAAFYGTGGGVVLRNVAGSFYDFTVDRHRGTARENLSSPPDDWGGRAALDWVTRLAAGQGFESRAEQFTELAGAIDRVYGRGRSNDPIADGNIAQSPAAEFATSWSSP